MSYQSLHKANDHYKLAVLGILAGAFVLTWALMFVHPLAAILVFWAGLAILAIAAAVEWMVLRAERAAARHELRTHHCPQCGAIVHRQKSRTGPWRCDGCGSVFGDSGAEMPYWS